MKGWSKAMLAVGLVALLACMLLACGGGGGSAASTPEDTVRNFLSAMDDLNLDRMAACCTSDALEEVHDMGTPPPDYDIKISNLKLTVVSKDATEAEIDAEYYGRASYQGQTFEDTVYETYYLVNIGGKWYIEDHEEW